MHLPKAIGIANKNKTYSAGLGQDRFAMNYIKRAREIEKCDKQNSDCVSWALLAQRNIEMNNINNSRGLVNKNIVHLLDMDENNKNMDQHRCSLTCDMNKSNIPPHKRPPILIYGKMLDKDVKRRTGFISEKMILAFILVVNNGDLNAIEKDRVSVLTWYEEWFFYLEWIWGRTLTRWQDAASEQQYHVDEKTLMNIFDNKRKTVLRCRLSWPVYLSYEEDRRLRKTKWNNKYEGHRVVFWDDTNISFCYKPSGANEQRLTYSSYYGKNCAKGGVFLQLSGWLGVEEELWTGATSDTHYQEQTGIFQRQDMFSRNDTVESKHIPFTNIFDKGYRSRLAAWRCGRQLTLQPDYAKSDMRFRGIQTLQSASIATDRSGNECAVNVCKLSGILKRGLTSAGDWTRMNDVWLAWSFQANFMFKPVL
jgi:hypothetical protein